jgi:hypothetical protein
MPKDSLEPPKTLDYNRGRGDWRPNMERVVLGVLHRHGVDNAAALAKECAQQLQPVVNGVRTEQMEAAMERAKALVQGYLFNVVPEKL